MTIFQRALALLLIVLQVLLFPVVSLIFTGGKLSTAPLDRMKDAHYDNATGLLCDPEATPEALALMAWLKAQYGSYMLSGQYVSPYNDYTQPQFRDENGNLDVRLTDELDVVQSVNGGKYPAVLGLDFTGAEYPAQWRDWVTQFALQWHELGGVVTFCWHWLVPKDMTKDPATWSRYDSAIYSKDTNFDLKAALADKSSPSYQWLLQCIDKIAAQLQALQDAGVPILWRPLHEASGAWFWWGDAGKEAYLELYTLVFDKLTVEYGLHNLIWLWNAQNNSWYPGDDRVDMLADDPYQLKLLYPLDPAQAIRFKYTARASGTKMVAMSENETIPDLDMMWRQNVKWLFFCTWDREKVLKPNPEGPGQIREYLDYYNSAEKMKAVHADPRVITLDEMNWKQGD